MIVRGAIVLRNRGAAGVAFIAFLVALGSLALTAFAGAPWQMVEYPILALIAALVAHVGFWKPTERAADLRADEQGLHVDGVLVRERSKLARARILPRDKKAPIVELSRKTDPYPMRVVVPTVEAAQELVRALGLDARLGMTLFETVGKTVTIGGDGIAVEGVLGRRFIPWREVVDLERTAPPGNETVSRGFLVHLRDGESVRIDTYPDRLRDGAFDSDHYFDAACLARGAARKREPSAVRVGLLRGGRPVKDWLAGLRSPDTEGYRIAALSEDEMLAVLEDPTATEELRAGAAARLAALGKTNAGVRERIRIAAEGVAEPKLRVAIDAVLLDDDEALETALESLSQLTQRP